MTEGKGYIFVVERVKHAFEQAGIANINFVSLDDVERDASIVS